jgi:CBS domain-containing protein
MPGTARDVMTKDPDVVDEHTSVLDAARRLAELDVGAVPICTSERKLVGMLTDRDIVTQVLAQGKDPASVKAGELAQGEAVTIGADDSIEETLRTMARHQVRRLPVIDGTELVGVVAQADVARALPEDRVGDLVEAISQ